MPIEKVPVVHRFGIISHNQRLELQDRLLQRAADKATFKPYERAKNPNELHESFIERYNNVTSVAEREKLEFEARKHLERLKRKCGLSKNCEVGDEQLDEAWVDLTILAQCNGTIQEESLEVLITTLTQALFDKKHIKGLFFLAETSLYWLRTDAINSPYLRTSEIKLLKMAYYVFLRLFYHHMVGDLRGHRLFKSRLFMYLDGLQDYQEAYSPYPNAHLCLRYVIEVGKVIFLDDDIDPGEMKERLPEAVDTRSHFAINDARTDVSTVSRSVHDLTPTLWHALDVWRCITVTGKHAEDALISLYTCGLGMALESWIDSVAAMLVLTETAKYDLKVLEVLQKLVCGVISLTEAQWESHSHVHDYRVEQTLAASPDEQVSKAKETKTAATTTAIRKENYSEKIPPKTPSRKVSRQSQRSPAQKASNMATDPNEQSSNQGAAASKQEIPDTQPADRESAVTPTTYGNMPEEGVSGIQGWQWEVAVTYTELLAELVVYGKSSVIQKAALLGGHKTPQSLDYHSCRPPLQSAGLVDMLNFHLLGDSLDNNSGQDWSWRVRYAAVQGLIHVCSLLEGDTMSDGLYNIAWRCLLDANSFELDEKVLEALKVGQIHVKQSSKQATPSNRKHASLCGARLADGLTKTYLPPVSLLKPIAKPAQPQPMKGRSRSKLQANKSTFVQRGRRGENDPVLVVRTTLGDERMFADITEPRPIADYQRRTDNDLMRIVEDQWRKELHNKLKEEEKEKEEEEKKKKESAET